MAGILTIVVTFNGMEWIGRCLGSVLSSVVHSDVMVIDNCSEDGTPDWVAEHFPDVILVRNESNAGFAAANNTGFRYALQHDYGYVYLLNQDAWVFPETFATLIRVCEASADAGILSPMQMASNLTEMDVQFAKHCGKQLKDSMEEVVRVPFVMAAHWMIPRECLNRTGAFSPSFPHYGEDNNFIDRAAFHGFKAVVVKTAVAVHDRGSRPRPKSYRMNLKCINARVKVADPRRTPAISLLLETVRLSAMGVLHFSTIPWKGIGELWSAFPELKRTRLASKMEGAFLD